MTIRKFIRRMSEQHGTQEYNCNLKLKWGNPRMQDVFPTRPVWQPLRILLPWRLWLSNGHCFENSFFLSFFRRWWKPNLITVFEGSVLIKLIVGIPRTRGLLYSHWQSLGIIRVPFAINPLGHLYQSPPLPIPFLCFFPGWWIPNLITGLSGWCASNQSRRTQEIAPDRCWPSWGQTR